MIYWVYFSTIYELPQSSSLEVYEKALRSGRAYTFVATI